LLAVVLEGDGRSDCTWNHNILALIGQKVFIDGVLNITGLRLEKIILLWFLRRMDLALEDRHLEDAILLISLTLVVRFIILGVLKST